MLLDKTVQAYKNKTQKTLKELLIKSKNYERRADKRSASADNSGGCATPKVEFWHPTRLNQSFLNFLLISMTFNILLGTAYYYKDILFHILNTLQL